MTDPKQKPAIDFQTIRESLQQLFTNEFKKRNFQPEGYFDYGVWFLNQTNIQQYQSRLSDSKAFQNFKDMLESTPSETDDIIKFTITKAFMRNKNKHFRINVGSFIDEVLALLEKLDSELKRVEVLIKKYDAYETKNILEQNLSNIEKFFNTDATRSTMHFYLSRVEGILKGDYKLSLIGCFRPDANQTNVLVNEEAFDYKLNHLLKIPEDYSFVSFNESEYAFKPIEFFSYDSNFKSSHDAGTNLTSFILKLENLSSKHAEYEEDIVYSKKKPILDLFLGNMKSLMNNFKKVKVMETDLELKNQYGDFAVKLKAHVELDPFTLSNIYSKVLSLLQELISYKVQTDHKWKTIMSYFPEIEPDVLDLFKNGVKQDTKCLIY